MIRRQFIKNLAGLFVASSTLTLDDVERLTWRRTLFPGHTFTRHVHILRASYSPVYDGLVSSHFPVISIDVRDEDGIVRRLIGSREVKLGNVVVSYDGLSLNVDRGGEKISRQWVFPHDRYETFYRPDERIITVAEEAELARGIPLLISR